ncbi:MAG: outer membrane protein assembly factor, partial [Bacteroidetes bacterium]|nr:outer membrane protein assembly factor [Bacteroidota bacterium]
MAILLLMNSFFTSCSVTKNFESTEYLLIKNRIVISDHHILAEELEPYIQQQPNNKFMGLFRSNIALYNLGSKGENTKFKNWLKTKAGTAPVILDTSLATTSLKQMGLYLANKGYFNSTLTDTIIYDTRKAK